MRRRVAGHAHGRRKPQPLLWFCVWYLFTEFESRWSLRLLGVLLAIGFSGFSSFSAFNTFSLSEGMSPRSPVKLDGARLLQVKPSHLLERPAFWKCVTLFNAACWGATYICTKAGIDALLAAEVQDASAVFQFVRVSVTFVTLILRRFFPVSCLPDGFTNSTGCWLGGS